MKLINFLKVYYKIQENLFQFQQQNNTQISSKNIYKVFLEKFENFLNQNSADSETRLFKIKIYFNEGRRFCFFFSSETYIAKIMCFCDL